MQQKILAAAVMDPISMPAGLMRGRGCTRLQQLSLELGLGWGSAFSRPSCRVATPISPGPPLADGPRNKRHNGACSKDTSITQVQCIFEQLSFVWLCTEMHLKHIL